MFHTTDFLLEETFRKKGILIASFDFNSVGLNDLLFFVSGGSADIEIKLKVAEACDDSADGMQFSYRIQLSVFASSIAYLCVSTLFIRNSFSSDWKKV